MDFQSVNLLNMQTNMISGNLFPMTTDNLRFSIGWKIYSVVVWLVTIPLVVAFFSGFFMVPKVKAITDGMIGAVFSVEVFFMVVRINTHRDLFKQLIQKMNDILRVQDETMRCVVMASLKLMHSPLKFYWLTGIITVIIWISMPLTSVFKKDSFLYEDYRLPFAISKQPFSTKIFLLGGLLSIICSVSIVMKKVAIDIYMTHFVLLMTAQYRYIAVKLQKIFQEENSQDKRDNSHTEYPRTDSWTETEMKAICRHHNNVVHMSYMLKKLLSLNFSLIYVNNILRFSFVGIMLSNTTLLTTFLERIAIILFASGEIIQFYILCSSVQALLDASTNMTDMAFHENWYQRAPSIKRKFMLTILANNLKCKLAAFGKFNITLPSFMAIMNQAYSIALLCLKIVKN